MGRQEYQEEHGRERVEEEAYNGTRLWRAPVARTLW
jgi:hypothetical protein